MSPSKSGDSPSPVRLLLLLLLLVVVLLLLWLLLGLAVVCKGSGWGCRQQPSLRGDKMDLRHLSGFFRMLGLGFIRRRLDRIVTEGVEVGRLQANMPLFVGRPFGGPRASRGGPRPGGPLGALLMGAPQDVP
ncbi:hypothetical protein ACSSS7_007687 [Eimeria intestinalis]